MKPVVVLLHGLARGQGSSTRRGRALRAAGFETWSHTYPSRRHSITYLADALAEQLVALDRPLSAVTHSLGGVIVRHLHDPRLRWERIVLLAPPNQGSRLAAGLVRPPEIRREDGPRGRRQAD